MQQFIQSGDASGSDSHAQFAQRVRMLLAEFPSGAATFTRHARGALEIASYSLVQVHDTIIHPVHCSPPLSDELAREIDTLVRDHNAQIERGRSKACTDPRGADDLLSPRNLDFLFETYGRRREDGVREITEGATRYAWTSDMGAFVIERNGGQRVEDARDHFVEEPHLAKILRGHAAHYQTFVARQQAHEQDLATVRALQPATPSSQEQSFVAAIGRTLGFAGTPQAADLGDSLSQNFRQHDALFLDPDDCRRLEALAGDSLVSDVALANIGLYGSPEDLERYLQSLETIQERLWEQRGGEIAEEHVRDAMEQSELSLDPNVVETLTRLVREGRLNEETIVRDIRGLSAHLEIGDGSFEQKLEAFHDLIERAERSRSHELDHGLTHHR